MEQDSTQTVRILLVEDDLNLGYLMVENLEAKGIDVTLARTGKEGADAIAKGRFDLCIFDIMLPETDGLRLGNRLKLASPSTPFIYVTARAQEADRLAGFEAGADDYITKPFSFRELYYRIQAILKRTGSIAPRPQPTGTQSIGNVTLNADDRLLTVNGAVKKLSRREADVLQKLMQHAGSYVGRSEILKLIWGRDDYFTAKSMDVYITRIRKLLKDDPAIELENLYGSGFRLRKTQ